MDTPANLYTFCANIESADRAVFDAATARHLQLTKPTGSLGRLETLGIQYAAARSDLSAAFHRPTLLNFAADHGVAEEGVSAYPQEVTCQMVHNFSNGGAAINVLTRQADAILMLTDIGVKGHCAFPGVNVQKIRAGTDNIAKGPAMSVEEALAAIQIGIDTANKAIDLGATLIGVGEMGIANTTPAAAIFCTLLNVAPETVVGRGTGISDAQLVKKLETVIKALTINQKRMTDPLSVLAAVGGFDIAGMCGAVLGAVSRRVPVVADGFISGAAILLALRFAPQIHDSLFFSHCSAELGHKLFMRRIQVEPLFDYGLRLGEGSGAALAFPIIRAAAAILREMATFDQAGVIGARI